MATKNWRTNPAILRAKAACQSAHAKAAILITFDEESRFDVVSYGVTGALCKAVDTVAGDVFDALTDGRTDVDPLSVAIEQERS